jgi:hypothetical protein
MRSVGRQMLRYGKSLAAVAVLSTLPASRASAVPASGCNTYFCLTMDEVVGGHYPDLFLTTGVGHVTLFAPIINPADPYTIDMHWFDGPCTPQHDCGAGDVRINTAGHGAGDVIPFDMVNDSNFGFIEPGSNFSLLFVEITNNSGALPNADITLTSTPEPASFVLVAAGLGVLGVAGYRRRKVS